MKRRTAFLAVRPPFEDALRSLINRYCVENRSDTPDFILARYMRKTLDAFNDAVCARQAWHGHKTFGTCDAGNLVPPDSEPEMATDDVPPHLAGPAPHYTARAKGTITRPGDKKE